MRYEKIDQGRLVARIQEEEPNSAWIVRFNDRGLEDAKVLEEGISHMLARTDDVDNGPSKIKESSKLRTAKAKATRTKSQSDGGGTGSGSESDTNFSRKKSVNLQHENDESNVDVSGTAPNSESPKYVSSGEDGKVTSREQRSRRRQLILDDEEVPRDELMQGVAPLPKKSKTQVSDEVVKIPMLTGTLYLYRGVKRSVAFIRKV